MENVFFRTKILHKTNWRYWIITDHVIFNLCYNQICQLKTTLLKVALWLPDVPEAIVHFYATILQPVFMKYYFEAPYWTRCKWPIISKNKTKNNFGTNQNLFKTFVIRKGTWFVSNFWILKCYAIFILIFFQLTKLRQPTVQRQLLENKLVLHNISKIWKFNSYQIAFLMTCQ